MMVLSATPVKQSVHVTTLRRLSLTGMSLIALFGGTIGVWAAVSTLSGAGVAPAQFVVDSSVKKVQHATGGIVGELRVREGDRVNEGDILVRLDETMTRANLQIVVRPLDELLARPRPRLWGGRPTEPLARQARLEAERDGSPVIEPVDELTARMSDPAVAKL